MKLQLVPARTGILWVRLGVRTFWRQPMALTGLFFLCMAAMSLATVLPLVGTALALALLPSATLVMMVASAHTEGSSSRLAAPALMVSALRSARQRLRSMALLGLLYAAGFLLLLGLSALVDGGEFAGVYLGVRPVTQELAESGRFQAAMWLAVLLYLPLSLLFWHAPALVHWWGVAPVKAMFFSAVACLRNIGAFTVYALGWAGLFMATGIVVSLVLTVLSELGMGTGLAASVLVTTAIVLAAMFFSSIVFSFRDCFEPTAHPAAGQDGAA
ncbi:BPSS1780 family membrane protein [Comamonas flocculans]|uniref:DUF2189 domain-containing protein n=1 Tax=Comamonas flocculans TaxID=2597701 RepID=A0A5B8RU42_9BURK|nr:BPSS1780 family membrane protein [Comamonas flocculans]QEA12242.1 hypothetical protein FOZ74_03875 [Comamonas flocculans]